MALGARMLLNSLGISVSDHDIQMLEKLIPQIPGKANEVLVFIQNKGREYDDRFAALELSAKANNKVLDAVLIKLTQLEDTFNAARDDIRSATTGTGKRTNGSHRSN